MTTMIHYASVCSGIEAAAIALHPLGFNAQWFSDTDPFASAVLAHHYPHIPNHGDMCTLPERIGRGEIPPPDLLCAGTPCQAFNRRINAPQLTFETRLKSTTVCQIYGSRI